VEKKYGWGNRARTGEKRPYGPVTEDGTRGKRGKADVGREVPALTGGEVRWNTLLHQVGRPETPAEKNSKYRTELLRQKQGLGGRKNSQKPKAQTARNFHCSQKMTVGKRVKGHEAHAQGKTLGALRDRGEEGHSSPDGFYLAEYGYTSFLNFSIWKQKNSLNSNRGVQKSLIEPTKNGGRGGEKMYSIRRDWRGGRSNLRVDGGDLCQPGPRLMPSGRLFEPEGEGQIP